MLTISSLAVTTPSMWPGAAVRRCCQIWREHVTGPDYPEEFADIKLFFRSDTCGPSLVASISPRINWWWTLRVVRAARDCGLQGSRGRG